MSLREELLEEGTIIGEGSFSLDRGRAMEKLARFQLEDPHRYVLELIAAGICAGSREIVIRNDADDLELFWDGDHPTEAELDGLFDHIFYQGDDPRQRMLQHLAQGLYGAQGLSPRWVRLERPGLTLDLTDLLSITRAENDRTEGVFIHVRERFSWKVLREAVSPFDDAYEAKLIRQHASLAPIPITINNSLITDVPVAPPDGVLSQAVDGGVVWLAGADEALDPRLEGGVIVTRDGVTVQIVHLSAGPLRLAGRCDAPTLRLNASRSAAIEDAAWMVLLDQLQAALAALLRARLAQPGCPLAVEQAVLALIVKRPELAATFEADVLFVDVHERPWSLAGIRAAGGASQTSDPELLEEAFEGPLWLTETGLKARGHHPLDERHREQVPVIRAVLGALKDATAELRLRREGRQRRELLEREGGAKRIGARALLSVPLEGPGLTGALTIPRSGGEAGLEVALLVDGLPVEVMALPARCCMRGWVESPDFKADARFRSVLDSPTRRAVRPLLLSAADALLARAAAEAPTHPIIQPALLRWAKQLAPGHGADLDAWLSELPPGLTTAPLFTTMSGASRSMRQLVGKPAGMFPADKLPEIEARLSGLRADIPAPLRADTLLVDAESRAVLRRLLGRQLSDHSGPIFAAANALWRKAQPQVRPSLPGPVDHRMTIREDGLVGIIGLVSGGSASRVQIIHQGVPLGEHAIGLGLPGVVAAVSWDAAIPDEGWEGLADPMQLARLSTRLRPLLNEMVYKAAAQRSPQQAFPEWLAEALRRSLDPRLLDVTTFATMAGEHQSLRDIKKLSRVRYTSDPPRPLIPDMGDVLLLQPSELKVLKAHIKKRRLQDVTRRLREVRKAWERFSERPTEQPSLPPDVRYALTRRFREGGLRGIVGVREEAGGLTPLVRIRCLLDRRLLDTLFAPHFLVVDAVVWGPGVASNLTRSGVEAPKTKAAIITAVSSVTAALTRSLLQDPETMSSFSVTILDQLLRRQPMPGLGKQEQADLLTELKEAPLFPTLGGRRQSLAALKAAHAEKRLRLVDRKESRAGPGDRVWVPADEALRRPLQAGISRRIPDGSGELEAWHRATRRRSTLAVVPAMPPRARTLAAWLDESEGRTTWIALTSAQQDTLAVEWRVEERIIQTDKHPAPVAISARVTDPDLRPDDRFEALAPGRERDRAQDRIVADIAAFMLALARQISLDGSLRDAPAGLRIGDASACRLRVLAWAAGERLSDEWEEVRLVRCADGSALGPVQLKALAEVGPLRVVSHTVSGRTLDPDRPAIRCPSRSRHRLFCYGELEDYTLALAREEAELVRRSTPGRPRQAPRGRHVVLSVPAPGGRDGFVQVHEDGSNAVMLLEEWRELGVASPRGPIPLTGCVSDDALSPDGQHRRPVEDAAYHNLLAELADLSEAVLPQLLAVLDPERHRRLIFKVAARAFPSRSALGQATKGWGTLADLPLLRKGDGTPCSLRDVALLPGEPRWVFEYLTASSLSPERPFIRLATDDLDVLKGLLGGERVSTEEALAEASVVKRRAEGSQPFELPQGDYLGTEATGEGAFRALVGLAAAPSREGALVIRCEGVSVEERSIDMVGLVVVIEVPMSSLDPGWTSARLPKKLLRSIKRTHRTLLQASAEAMRASPDWMAHAAAALESGDSLFEGLPLVMTEQGPLSVKALRRHGQLLLQAKDVDGTIRSLRASVQAKRPLVVENTQENVRLLAAGKLTERCVLERRWLEQQHHAEQAVDLKLRTDQLAQAVCSALLAASRGVVPAREVRDAVTDGVLVRCPLYEDALGGDAAAVLLTAVWVADGLLSARPEPLGRVLASLGRALVREQG